jgi:hypothetical protein
VAKDIYHMDIKVTFKRPSLEAETEVGSFSELAGLLQNEEATLVKLFGSDMEMVLAGVNAAGAQGAVQEAVGEAGVTGDTPKVRKKRQGADPATAQAPAPIPVPNAAPAAPTPPAASLALPADGGIPAFLDRTTAASPPPPPLVPPPAAPPVAPVAPTPPGVLGAKVEAELRRRGTDKAAQDGIVAWLVNPAVAGKYIMPGASFEEALSVILMTTDDKLTGLLGPLQIAA